MAIAIDTSTANVTDGSATATYAHTCTGSDLVLIVGVMVGTGNTVSGVTYNGVSMTQINTQAIGGATFDNMYLFRLVAPATGSNNVVITASASTFIYSTAASYTGVDQTNPIDVNTTTTATATNLTLTMTTTVDNTWLVGFWGIGEDAGDDDFTAGANTTERASDTAPGIWFSSGDTNAAQTPAGSKSINLTNGVSQLKGANGCAIAPAVPVTFIPRIMMS